MNPAENSIKPQNVWIYHNNCDRECPHCFSNPTTKDDMATTEKLAGDLERHGLNYYIFATDQMDARLASLYSRVNFGGILVATPRLNKDLLKLRPDIKRLVFSLHGPTAEIHELISPRGDFEVTMESLRDFRDNDDIDIEIYCVIHGKNYHLLKEICQLSFEHGVSAIQFIKLGYGGRATGMPGDFFLTENQIRIFSKEYYRIRNRFKPMEFHFEYNWGPRFSKFRILYHRIFGRFQPKSVCRCGIDHVTIKSDSRDVYPCRLVVTRPELKMGRFDSDRGLILTNNWHDDLDKKIGEPCKSCRIFNSCHGGCRAGAILEKQRLTGELDIFAGFANCPVSMGITEWFNYREDFPSLIKKIRIAFFITLKKLGISKKYISWGK